MPKLGLGLSLPQTIASGPFTPKKLSGLSLWLKADAGVSQSQGQYVSQIVISGAGSSSFNGTYIATSEPNQDGEYFLYTFDNKIMSGSLNGGFDLYDNPSLSCYSSTNGTTWTATYVRPSTITISNANVSGANGTYTYDGWNGDGMIWTKNNGSFHIVSYPGEIFVLYDDATEQNLYQSTQSFGSLPTGTWVNAGAGGTCTGTAVSFPTGAAPTGVTTFSSYGPINVDEWADQSGNERNATPTYLPPVYVSSAINNKPAIQFSDDELRGLSFSHTGFYPKTIFAVGTISVDNMYRTMVGGNSSDVLGNYYLQTRANMSQPGFVITNDDETGYIAFANALTLNVPYLLGGYSDFLTNVYAFKNGVVGSSVAASNAQRSLTTGYVGCGYYNGEPSDRWNGYIAEVIIYNRVLTTTERQKVEAYLNTKYAIY